jgi:hypothetical protein
VWRVWISVGREWVCGMTVFVIFSQCLFHFLAFSSWFFTLLHPRSDVAWDSGEDTFESHGTTTDGYALCGEHRATHRMRTACLFTISKFLFARQCIDCPDLLLLDDGVWCCAVGLFGVQVFCVYRKA